MPAHRASTTRRGALGGALGLVLVSACDVDDLRPPEDEATPVMSPTPGATQTPEPDADTTLAEDTAYDIASALVVVTRVRRTFPRLSDRLQPLVRMHRAHLAVLEPPHDRSIPVPEPSDTPAKALTRVRSTEEALQRNLASAAVEAQSGALARLLASMSASVSQHLTALPTPSPVAEEQQ